MAHWDDRRVLTFSTVVVKTSSNVEIAAVAPSGSVGISNFPEWGIVSINAPSNYQSGMCKLLILNALSILSDVIWFIRIVKFPDVLKVINTIWVA